MINGVKINDLENKIDIKTKECKIDFQQTNKNIKTLSFDKDFQISNIKEKDSYTIIALHKIEPLNDNSIKYVCLKLEIIKNLSFKKNLKKTTIKIEYEKKDEIEIKKKRLSIIIIYTF